MTVLVHVDQTRRNFLKLMTALVLAFPMAGSATALPSQNQARADLARISKSIFGRCDILPIGAAYLAQHPQEAHERLLSDRIMDDTLATERSQLLATDVCGIERDLEKAVRRDFEQGRVECLKGWRLSRTEARLCALACLSQVNLLRLEMQRDRDLRHLPGSLSVLGNDAGKGRTVALY